MASSEELAPQGFAELIGTEWVSLEPDDARATIEVRPDHLQPYGIVHGGVYAALAESLTSAATYNAVKDDDMVAMGMSNNTAFLRPITEGRIEAVGKARSQGKTTWVWDVDIIDSEGRVCAVSRVTIAVRPLRRP